MGVPEGLGTHITTGAVSGQSIGEIPKRQSAMNSKIDRPHGGHEGFSLIELLIVVAIIGIIAAIAVPQLMDAMDRARQRRSMADMRNIATANGTMRIDTGNYAAALADLPANGYMQVTPANDGWGNPYTYIQGADSYELESLGSDGAAGPAPPNPWINAPYEPDISLISGQFSQAPTGQ